MPRSRGGSRASSRSGSRAGSRAYSESASRTRSLGVGTRGDDPKYSGRSRSSVKGEEASATARVEVCSPARSVASRVSSVSETYLVGKAKTKHKRHKRGGYNHPAAVQSAPDLFYGYPADNKKEAKDREDPFRRFLPAGLNSSRMQELFSTNLHEDGESKAKALYQPPTRSDPITHQKFEDEMQCRDPDAIRGAAGLATDRLTFLLMTGVKPINTKKQEMYAQQKKTDPITHVGGPPDKIKTGIRRFSGVGTHSSRVPLYHDSGVPEKMRPEDVLKLKKTKIVRTGKGVMYIHAGLEDMIPPATNNYSKADLPPSAAHKAENDRRLLPGFYRNKNMNPSETLVESEDMYYSMYGQDWVDAGMPGPEDFRMPVEMSGPSGSITQRARDDIRIPIDNSGVSRAKSARLRRSKSAVDFRRASAAGSVVESDLPSYTSVDGKTRGVWSSPNNVTLASNYDGLCGETITL